MVKQQKTSRRGSRPRGHADGQRPFLKADCLKKGQKEATITIDGPPRRMTGQYGPQIIIPVQLAGKPYDWAVKDGGQAHSSLRKAHYSGQHRLQVRTWAPEGEKRTVIFLALVEPIEQDDIPF